MALSKFDGWVGETLLRSGDEYPDDHPLVVGRPEMFEVEQEPEPPVTKVEPPAVPVEPPAPPERKKPGPKPRVPRG